MLNDQDNTIEIFTNEGFGIGISDPEQLILISDAGEGNKYEIDVGAGKLTMQADSEIEVKSDMGKVTVDASEIELKAGSITIDAPEINITGAMITLDANTTMTVRGTLVQIN